MRTHAAPLPFLRELLSRALIAIVFLAGASPVLSATVRALSLEERIRAQEAIERVYFAHREGSRRTFEEAVPREVIERKVEGTLRLSTALAEWWHRPVTGAMLRAEQERIERETHLPARLQEIYDALDRDPVLIRETFVRSVLVERLARSWFASDDRIHAAARREAEALRDRLTRERAVDRRDPAIEIVTIERTAAGTAGGSPEWRLVGPGAAAPGRARSLAEEHPAGPPGVGRRELPGERGSPLSAEQVARWRAALPESPDGPPKITEEPDGFTVGVLLPKDEGRIEAAFRHVPKRTWDEWWSENMDRFSDEPAGAAATVAERSSPAGKQEGVGVRVQPLARQETDAGEQLQALTATSSAPCLPDDVWTPYLSLVPSAGEPAVTVWTGNRMIVFGNFTNGGMYDPLTDSWTPLPTGSTTPYSWLTRGVWTGTEMIVWGSAGNPTPYNTGGRFDPVAGTWTPTSQIGAPTGRYYHSVVWSGTRMIVWGGIDDTSPLDTGGIYDPATDTWTPVSTVNAPSARVSHTAVWTGTEMIVFGGFDWNGLSVDTASYDPATDSWSAISTTGAPSPRYGHVAVWTGSRMIVWGGKGFSGSGPFGDGGLYDPNTDSWSPVSMTGSPAPVHSATASWTGTEMILWGGQDAGGLVTDAGGRYDPDTDSWTATTTVNAPLPAYNPGSVWTGTEMIVWGGNDGTTDLSTGGRYDPSSGTWVPTPVLSGGRPTWVLWDAAVWTGSEMIIWGGSESPYSYGGINLDTGARYDPLTSVWTPTTTTGAPEGRVGHSAVWTGDTMIVWGGSETIDGYATSKISGGIYDPVADAWTPTSEVDAPSARMLHWAFWTGSRMLVWGGTPDMCTDLDTGALYDPDTDTWSPTSLAGAAGARDGLFNGTAVWTGSEMIVWGGFTWWNCQGFSNLQGARYDPSTDTWSPMADAPFWRNDHSAQWTGTEMIVWGGDDYSFPPGVNTGARYDPVLDEWFPTSTLDAPEPRYTHTTVWTGHEMIVWGGTKCVLTSPTSCHGADPEGGGRYDPSRDVWTPMSRVEEPKGRRFHHAIWTGQEMLIQGGESYPDGRYALGGGTDNDGDGISECDGDCDDANPNVYPGAPVELCDGEDTDCDGIIPADEIDGDGDGYLICDGGDCDDYDPGVWAPPAPVTINSVEVLDGSLRMRIHWDPQSASSGPATTYDVFSGSVGLLTPGGDFSTGTCAAYNDSASYFDDTTPDPPLGEAAYFILRAQNPCGEGTYGDANRDITEALSSVPCP